jgi:hypothetical protein
MTYCKPELTALGTAAEVIQQMQKPNTIGTDGIYAHVPAYDLDE